jgi:hypothetical protein
MKIHRLLLAGIATLLARPAVIIPRPGEFRGRARTRDVAFQFRSNAGFPGRVNRTHPASIVPYLNDATNPVLLYGLGCVVNPGGNDVRGFETGDTTAAALFGISVSPFPFQASTGSAFGGAAFGVAVPAPALPIDILKSGFIMVTVNGSPNLGGAVDVWFAASGGGHTQGGFEATHTGGSSVTLTSNTYWNGPPDPNGNAELAFNL